MTNETLIFRQLLVYRFAAHLGFIPRVNAIFMAIATNQARQTKNAEMQ